LHTEDRIENILRNWPEVTFREVSRLLGQINSMHTVLRGTATLRSKFLQTLVNIRHFNEFAWERNITSEFPGLFDKAKNEIHFWKDNLRKLNFRRFLEPVPSCIGWVDASDYAVGGILVKLVTGARGAMPVTMDNWVLDGSGVLPRIRNCARAQVDGFPSQPKIVTDHDLDPR
ncbi:MAG: hypothetical protein ACK559_19555, partial [bacterium]